jgi:hypothetical protein
MLIHRRVPYIFTCCLLFTGLLSSCYKKDIQVGSELANSHTRLITVDTVTAILSSYVLDSFPTSGNNVILVGNYKDAYLGNTTISSFFQPGFPTLPSDISTLLPKNAVFDSLMLYMRPSGYFYGDTTKPLKLAVYRLTDQPDYTNLGTNRLYNTSNIGVFPTPLATFSQKIRPAFKDSVKIKLPNALGKEFFTKIQSNANEFLNATNFMDYFRGLSVKPDGNDTGAVYGFNVADSSVRVRLHFHLTLPYRIDNTIDFILTRTSYQFNRVITDRSNTPLAPVPGQNEYFASNKYPYAFTQSGTGVLLKVKFPSLRDVLKINEVVKLMGANLILRQVKGTYDIASYRLPTQLFMAQTDASNVIGGALIDTTGAGIQYRDPVVDWLYGINSYYNFNISSYVNNLLNNGSGAADGALFIMQQNPASATKIDRAVIGSAQNVNYQTKLVVNLLTID